MEDEVLETIPNFSNYQISNYGRVYNEFRDIIMKTSLTPFGHVKVNLLSDDRNSQHTRSVAKLVAEAFVGQPYDRTHAPYLDVCDQVIMLDGNLQNLYAGNLMWRPRWFAWKYTRQLKEDHPVYYHNLPVVNRITGARYNSIIEAGMAEGLLFEHIWKSTHTGVAYFPYRAIFEIDEERVSA